MTTKGINSDFMTDIHSSNQTIGIEELKKLSRDKTSYRNRLMAVQGLRTCGDGAAKDIIINLALHDKVFEVKEAAFRVAQEKKYTKKGKPIRLRKKDIGYKSADITKAFKRIKRDCKMQELDLEVFKDKWKIINPEMYDVMQYEKDNKFDEFIKNEYKKLPKE